MNRIELFTFFAVMSWVSLFSPKSGREMIDCADLGAEERDKVNKRQAVKIDGRFKMASSVRENEFLSLNKELKGRLS